MRFCPLHGRAPTQAQSGKNMTNNKDIYDQTGEYNCEHILNRIVSFTFEILKQFLQLLIIQHKGFI